MKTKNTLLDLNNHLFEQLERLNDEELRGKELEMEIYRSKAIKDVALTIVSNANAILNARKLEVIATGQDPNLPRLLTGDNQCD